MDAVLPHYILDSVPNQAAILLHVERSEALFFWGYAWCILSGALRDTLEMHLNYCMKCMKCKPSWQKENGGNTCTFR